MTEHNISGVTADAKIITRDGEQCIGDLAGRTTDVWNGKAFEPMTIKRAGKAKLCRARFENPKGKTVVIDCTENTLVPFGTSTIAIAEAHPYIRLRPFTIPGTATLQVWSLAGISKRATVADVYSASGIAVINGLLIGF